MPDPFEDMVDALADVDGFTAAGVFTPARGGTSLPCAVFFAKNDQAIPLIGTDARAAGYRLGLRKSEVPSPERNDLIAIASGRHAGTYQLRDIEDDPLNLTSKCTAELV